MGVQLEASSKQNAQNKIWTDTLNKNMVLFEMPNFCNILLQDPLQVYMYSFLMDEQVLL